MEQPAPEPEPEPAPQQLDTIACDGCGADMAVTDTECAGCGAKYELLDPQEGVAADVADAGQEDGADAGVGPDEECFACKSPLDAAGVCTNERCNIDTTDEIPF